MESSLNPFAEWLALLGQEELRYWIKRAKTAGSLQLASILKDEHSERLLPKLYPSFDPGTIPGS